MKEQLLELIFPPRCAVCTEVLDMEERRGILCHDCAEQLPYVRRNYTAQGRRRYLFAAFRRQEN